MDETMNIQQPTSAIWTGDRAWQTWFSGIFLGIGLLITYVLPDFQIELLSLYETSFRTGEVALLLAVLAGGKIILTSGYESLKNKQMDIHLLVSLAIIGALVVGLFIEAATLVFLFNIAELLEEFSIRKAHHSIRELMELSPDTARVIREEETKVIPLRDVREGDRVSVKPGEKIPLDGTVVQGTSAVNQSPITGESIPVDKHPGDEVFSGTLNEQGYLEIEVTNEASESMIAKIIQLVEGVRKKKTRREQFVQRFASYYTPAVVIVAVLSLVLGPVFLNLSWLEGVRDGITFLVLACPCAFLISTPVSIVSGVTSAARNGVLIKGGRHIEAMGEIDAVALDKTRTITKGELHITNIIPLNGMTEEDVLECARGIEMKSKHPIAGAIVEHAEETGVDQPEVTNFHSFTGEGVRAELEGTLHFAGKPDFFREMGFDLNHVHHSSPKGKVLDEARERCHRDDCLDILEDTIPRLQKEGKTIVLVSTEDQIEGIIALADDVRPDARAMIQQLKEAGIKQVIMVTGDHRKPAESIAREVGIDTVYAELLPDEKVEKIKQLDQKHNGVAMVGDGINDAPALASATVGIAMGTAGTDTALETADIALLQDHLLSIPYLCRLSRKCNRVIRQNIFSSLLMKAILALGVPFQLVSVALAVLLGDAGMTAAVTANAMRLQKPDQ